MLTVHTLDFLISLVDINIDWHLHLIDCRGQMWFTTEKFTKNYFLKKYKKLNYNLLLYFKLIRITYYVTLS